MRYLLLFLVLVLSVQGVSALSLNQTSISVEGVVGESIVVPIGVVNTDGESIYSLSFFPKNDTSFSRMSVLNASAQGFIIMSIKPSREGVFSFSTGSYFTKLRDVPREPKTVVVSITDGGFDPAIVTVKKDDSVRFVNNASSSHTVTQSGGFDYTVPVGGSQEILMQSVGIVDYFDRFSVLGGSVEVVSRESLEPVFFPQEQKTITVQVTARLAETNVSVRSLTEDTEAPHGQETDVVVEVKNTGVKVARGVRLSSVSDWVRFPNADIGDIPIGASKIIPFKIVPVVNGTSATNRSYVVDVTASGVNLPGVSAQVRVFVPFSIVLSNASVAQSGESARLLLELLHYCGDVVHKGEDACLLFSESEGDVRVIERFANINVSVGTIVGMQTDIAAQREALELFSKKQVEINDKFVTYLDGVNQSLAVTAVQTAESNQGFATLRGILYIFMFLVLFGVVLGGIVFGVVRWKQRRDAKEKVNYDG